MFINIIGTIVFATVKMMKNSHLINPYYPFILFLAKIIIIRAFVHIFVKT